MNGVVGEGRPCWWGKEETTSEWREKLEPGAYGSNLGFPLRHQSSQTPALLTMSKPSSKERYVLLQSFILLSSMAFLLFSAINS